jgi:hypothetical protein
VSGRDVRPGRRDLRRLAGKAPRLAALLALACLAGSGARARPQAGGTPPPHLIFVEVPGAALAGWEDCDGVRGRRFVEACGADGWILRPRDLHGAEPGLLDAWRRRIGGDVLWLARAEPAAPGDLRLEAASGRGLLWLGPPGDELLVRYRGLPPGKRANRMLDEVRAGVGESLGGAAELRWEEVVEMLDLTSSENLALRRLEDPMHPFARLTEAFVRDKRAANVGLYLLGFRPPAVLGMRLDLPGLYETEIVPFCRELAASSAVPSTLTAGDPESTSVASEPAEIREAIERRFFARRILASRGRVYGRLDRILQSLAGESPRGAVLVVDALLSPDPFVAVYRTGGSLGDAGSRGEALAGWLGRSPEAVEASSAAGPG